MLTNCLCGWSAKTEAYARCYTGARHKTSAMGTRESRPPFLNKKPMERGLLPAFYWQPPKTPKSRLATEPKAEFTHR
jgi:hypothetical protein